MSYQFFKDRAATLAYVESELVATLEDDVRDLISQGANSNRATINELKAKISDIGTAFSGLPVEEGPYRMWINQPSKLQPLHDLHGRRVLAVREDGEHTYRIYFLSGDVIDQQCSPNCLSDGWPDTSHA